MPHQQTSFEQFACKSDSVKKRLNSYFSQCSRILNGLTPGKTGLWVFKARAVQLNGVSENLIESNAFAKEGKSDDGSEFRLRVFDAYGFTIGVFEDKNLWILSISANP